MGTAAHITTNGTVLANQILTGCEENVHTIVVVQPIETFCVACLEMLIKTAFFDPQVHIAVGPVKKLLYFGHKLLAATITDTGGQKRRGFLVLYAVYLMHPIRRIADYKVGGLVAVGVTSQQLYCGFVNLTVHFTMR
jgi:hypothetical protein